MLKIKCVYCGDILRADKARDVRVKTGGMVLCSCGKTGLDWIAGTDRYRILGDPVRVVGDSDESV